MAQQLAQPEQESTAKSSKRSLPRMIILSTLLLVGGIFAFKKIHYSMHHESTDNAQVETLLVPVITRTPGYLRTIMVRDFDSVKAGQLVAELDDDELQSQLTQMKADLSSAEADLENAKAALSNARISLQVNSGNTKLASIRLEKAQHDLQRDQRLLESKAITQRQYDDSKFGMQTAEQQLNNSKTEYSAANSRIAILEAAIAKANASIAAKQAQIKQQELRIQYTKIYAPLGGKIGKKNSAVGQFTQAGTPLFTIVNDTTFWIVANFKENQIRKLHPGMPVDIDLDAYPNLHLKGSIESLSDATGARFALIPPDNASGNFVKVTQRVPVRIQIQDIAQYRAILRAGLSANISIPIE